MSPAVYLPLIYTEGTLDSNVITMKSFITLGAGRNFLPILKGQKQRGCKTDYVTLFTTAVVPI